MPDPVDDPRPNGDPGDLAADGDAVLGGVTPPTPEELAEAGEVPDGDRP